MAKQRNIKRNIHKNKLEELTQCCSGYFEMTPLFEKNFKFDRFQKISKLN